MTRRPKAGPLVVDGRTPDEIIAGAGIANSTIAEALECSHLMVWKWRTGRSAVSRLPGRAGVRFRRLVVALAAADRWHEAAVGEMARMDGEGHGDRWAKYDRRWKWRQSPAGYPLVIPVKPAPAVRQHRCPGPDRIGVRPDDDDTSRLGKAV